MGINQIPTLSPLSVFSTLPSSSVPSPRLAAHWQPCLAPWGWGCPLEAEAAFPVEHQQDFSWTGSCRLPKLGDRLLIRGWRGGILPVVGLFCMEPVSRHCPDGYSGCAAPAASELYKPRAVRKTHVLLSGAADAQERPQTQPCIQNHFQP